MLYPRVTLVNGKEALVDDGQMTGYKEHMTQSHRILFLSGVISGEMDSNNLLLAMDSLSHDPIKIIITSPGGDLDSTFLLVDTMRLIQSPVITIGRYCASAACLILAAGKERYLYPHAKTMLHLPTGQMGGDAKDWDIQHQQMTAYKNKIVDLLCECGATKSREQIFEDIDRDFWLDSQQTIDYGLADKVITTKIWGQWTKEKT